MGMELLPALGSPVMPGLSGSLPAKPAPGAAGAVKAAKDFESLLLHKVLEEMERTVPKDELLDDGATEQVQGLFCYHLAQDLADKGGLGLWKQVYRQMQATDRSGPSTVESRS